MQKIKLTPLYFSLGVIVLFFSLAHAQTVGGQSCGFGELTRAEQVTLNQTGTVLIEETIPKAIWPRIRAYQIIDQTNLEEVGALITAFDHYTKFSPQMRLVQTLDKPKPTGYETLVSWILVTEKAGEIQFTTRARFGKNNNRAWLNYSLTKPAGGLAKLLKYEGTTCLEEFEGKIYRKQTYFTEIKPPFGLTDLILSQRPKFVNGASASLFQFVNVLRNLQNERPQTTLDLLKLRYRKFLENAPQTNDLD